ncbi:MAG: alpha/beta hydrolase [Actinomycetota bacterium]|nr:alpha/beta hydrolase [Actinomycetota bacterium]
MTQPGPTGRLRWTSRPLGPLGRRDASRGLRRRHPVLGLVATVVGALSLSSCAVLPFVSQDPPATSAAPAPGSQDPPASSTGLTSFYSQRLSWSSCSGGECASLTVPVDYGNPGAGSLKLALLRVPAGRPSERLGSLVVNPGGPGGSGVDYAKAATRIVGAVVHDRFDVVGFDPRGVGRSAPLDCLGDAGLDTFLATDPTPDTGAEEQALLAQGKALGAGCLAKNPQLLAHVSTIDVAKDLDVLRAALGEAKLNYLGKSYGTFIGSTYAGLFPLKVGRMVLDGVVPPELSAQEVNLGQAEGFERATRAYVQDCIQQAGCPLGTTVDGGMRWLADFLVRVDAQPVPVTDDQRVTQLDEGWASIALAEAMYDQSYWSPLSDGLKAAVGGDGNLLMRIADAYADRTPGGQYTGNLLEVLYAVNCVDRPETGDLASFRSAAAAAEKVAPIFGRNIAWSSVVCSQWPVKGTDPPHTISAKGSGPIVVVGTTRDPATPYEWSVKLRQELANAVLISYDGDGHTAYKRSNACVDDPIDAYFVDGTTPQDGLRC